ncbi:hypothetical protein BDP27DRAFT_486944 [Rhodocollybia butyracea]|uniref:Uncharacterized protein n=1 Tax=Rhodocollybia butyracea TaxID=206335 RepID=A0A9P5QB46_9AGAR|nr:hypothetical protein BDP27DRAFT_486944 [Rhodocollybia butyracea]
MLMLGDASQKSSSATSFPDHKSKPSSFPAELATEEVLTRISRLPAYSDHKVQRKEVAMSVQVNKEMRESVQRGETLLVADVSRQKNQNDGSLDKLDPITPSPNVVSENFTVIPPISIEESSNTINFLMGGILPIVHA